MSVRFVFRLVGLLAFGLFLSACHQNGTVFAVDTTLDTVDSNPGDGVCSDASGDCSLRAAVMEANALPGVEEIRLVDGAVYELNIPGVGEDTSVGGDLDFISSVVVVGNGLITGPSLGEQLLHVNESAGLVEFDGPDLRSGLAGIRMDGASSSVLVRGMEASELDSWFYTQTAGAGFIHSSTAWRVPTSISGGAVIGTGGSLSIENFTLVGNGYQQGIRGFGADIVMRNSTLIGLGGQIMQAEALGSFLVQSSIVDSCDGYVTSLGHNLSTGYCPRLSTETDMGRVSYPTVDHLRDNGGVVPTVLINRNSPAFDGGLSGPCGPIGVDARGENRPSATACDIGAVEIQPSEDCTPRDSGDLRFCRFDGLDLDGASLRNADLTGSTFWNARLSGGDFSGAVMHDVHLLGADLSNADLSNTVLSVANSANSLPVIANGADFSNAEADGLYIRSAVGANFAGFSGFAQISDGMANTEVEAADFSLVYFFRTSAGGITGTPAAMYPGQGIVNGYILGDQPDLTGAGMVGTDLTAFVMGFATAQSADFTNATLSRQLRYADFRYATLDGADLAGADAYQVSFRDASAVGTDLSGADLRYSWWQNAAAVGVDFTNANLRLATFTDALVLWSTFDNTICPSGMNSDANGGDCDGQWIGRDPLAGAPVPAEFAGMGPEDFVPSGVVDD